MLRKREDLDFDFRLALAAEAVAVPLALRASATTLCARRQRASATNTLQRYTASSSIGGRRRLARIARKMLARHLADAARERIEAGYWRMDASCFSVRSPSATLGPLAAGLRSRRTKSADL